MSRRIAALVLVLSLAISGGVALAQDAPNSAPCPAGLACVDYGSDVTFELDPGHGKTQGIVVGELVRVAVFVDSGEGYILVGETIEPAEGVYEDAEFGDLFVLSERDQ